MLLKIIAESLKSLIKKIINVVFTQVFDFTNKLNGYRKKWMRYGVMISLEM